MSRIGRKPVKIPAGVKVELNGAQLKISGSSESLTCEIRPEIKVEYDSKAGEVTVSRSGDDRFVRALHGTMRALIANMVKGVTEGFKKDIEIYGTGYGIKEQGAELSFSLGFARPAVVKVPKGVKVEIQTPNTRGNDTPAKFSVNGPDKCLVGQFAANIRNLRPPEPYLGKGIRYADETIKRKMGKAFASSGS